MKRKNSSKKNNAATLGFEEAMLHPADKIPKHMHPSEYKDVPLGLIFLKYIDVPLGLIFLKYISDALEERREEICAEPIPGYTAVHGKKTCRMVHIGGVVSIVTEREIRETVQECGPVGTKLLDILGWDFEMGLHDVVDRISDENSVKIHLVQIPREVLEVRETTTEETKFFDLNYLEIEHKLNGKTLPVALKDLVISNPEFLSQEVREKVKEFTSYTDYWAVNFNYRNDTFHNMW